MPLIEDATPPLATIFEGLQGTWNLRRSLDSKLAGFTSGIFTGTATLARSPAFNNTAYLYHEPGELVTEQGYKLIANRKHIYRFSPGDEKLSVWFVKEPPDSGADEVDYLYHELDFERKDGRWIARGEHLCGMDMYWALYDFRLEQRDGKPALSVWGLRHQVKGPHKDCTSDTAYQRRAAGHGCHIRSS